MKKTILFSAIFAAVLGWSQQIDSVTVRQRWPWSKLVDINYVLTAPVGESYDIAVQAFNGNEPLSIPSSAFTGDAYSVSEGARRIVLDPSKIVATNVQMLTQFKVQLVPASIPLYMIVDLTKTAGAEGQIEYVYEEALTNGLWGTWERNPVGGVQSVIWTGVTNDIYKTDKLVMRRVEAGTFTMGGNGTTEKSVTLTKPFYVGVFETTQRQWEYVMGGTSPAYFNNRSVYAARPIENISYNTIRGLATGTPSVNWPETGYTVSPSSFMGKLRDKVGGKYTFDLPTDAQWEYVSRAGTATHYHDGNGLANIIGNNANSNEWVTVLGRYKFNGGLPDGVNPPAQLCEPINGTAVVGSYVPNAWGIYDTHGNVWEWVLDWLRGANDSPSGIDPTGLPSASARMRRGGSYDNPASECRSVSVGQYTPSSFGKTVGLRIVLAL